MKRKLLPLLLVAFLVVAAVVPMFAVTAAAAAGETITASQSIADLIVSEGWSKTTTNQSFKLDDNVAVKIDGGSNSGKAYDGDHIRLYATDTPAASITISVPEGYELVSVKITAQTGTYAFLYVDGDTTTDIQNTTVEVSGTSVKLQTVKNGTNGKQVRVTAIEVVYKLAGSSNPDAPACEHESTTSFVGKKDATCTEAGYTGDTVCNNPDCAQIVEKGTTINALGHDYVEKTTKPASCTEAGVLTKTCSVCGDVVEEEIKKLAHNFVDGFCEDCGAALPSQLIITFDDVNKRTEYSTTTQVWEENGITVTNNKDSSTTNVGDFSNPARFYKSSTFILECAYGNITKIVIDCGTNAQYTVWPGASVAEKIATIELDGSSNTYTVVLSEGQVRAQSITVYYESGSTCEHTNTTPEHKDATCTEAGYDKVYCEDCKIYISNTPIAATGHNLVNNVCANNCGLDVSTPEKIVAAAYALSKDEYLVNSDTKFTLTGVITGYYGSGEYSEQYKNVSVYIVVNGDTAHPIVCYRMKGTGADVIAVGDTITVTGSLVRYSDNVIEFAEGCSLDSYSKPITSPKFDAASMIISNDLTLNYLVKLPAGFDATTLTVKFTFNGETVEVTANPDLLADGRACFALANIAPQQIALNVEANLYCGEELLHTVEKYSVKKYIDNTLNDNPTAELKALLESVLVYAQSAKDYLGAEGEDITDKTVDANLEQPESDLDLDEDNVTEGQATIIYAGGIKFDCNNSLFVKYLAPNAEALTVSNGEISATHEYGAGYIAYISVTPVDFDKVFEITVTDGTITHTIKYSVNSYISAMWDDAEFGDLAKATYAFGLAAKNYTAANEDALVNN